MPIYRSQFQGGFAPMSDALSQLGTAIGHRYSPEGQKEALFQELRRLQFEKMSQDPEFYYSDQLGGFMDQTPENIENRYNVIENRDDPAAPAYFHDTQNPQRTAPGWAEQSKGYLQEHDLPIDDDMLNAAREYIQKRNGGQQWTGARNIPQQQQYQIGSYETGGEVGARQGQAGNPQVAMLQDLLGLGRGDIPIVAHEGEYVMNRGAVNAIGEDNLRQLNNVGQQLQSFQSGGRVRQNVERPEPGAINRGNQRNESTGSSSNKPTINMQGGGNKMTAPGGERKIPRPQDVSDPEQALNYAEMYESAAENESDPTSDRAQRFDLISEAFTEVAEDLTQGQQTSQASGQTTGSVSQSQTPQQTGQSAQASGQSSVWTMPQQVDSEKMRQQGFEPSGTEGMTPQQASEAQQSPNQDLQTQMANQALQYILDPTGANDPLISQQAANQSQGPNMLQMRMTPEGPRLFAPREQPQGEAYNQLGNQFLDQIMRGQEAKGVQVDQGVDYKREAPESHRAQGEPSQPQASQESLPPTSEGNRPSSEPAAPEPPEQQQAQTSAQQQPQQQPRQEGADINVGFRFSGQNMNIPWDKVGQMEPAQAAQVLQRYANTQGDLFPGPTVGPQGQIREGQPKGKKLFRDLMNQYNMIKEAQGADASQMFTEARTAAQQFENRWKEMTQDERRRQLELQVDKLAAKKPYWEQIAKQELANLKADGLKTLAQMAYYDQRADQQAIKIQSMSPSEMLKAINEGTKIKQNQLETLRNHMESVQERAKQTGAEGDKKAAQMAALQYASAAGLLPPGTTHENYADKLSQSGGLFNIGAGPVLNKKEFNKALAQGQMHRSSLNKVDQILSAYTGGGMGQPRAAGQNQQQGGQNQQQGQGTNVNPNNLSPEQLQGMSQQEIMQLLMQSMGGQQ